MPPKVFEWTQTSPETNPYDIKDVREQWQQRQGLKADLYLYIFCGTSATENLTELDKKDVTEK